MSSCFYISLAVAQAIEEVAAEIRERAVKGEVQRTHFHIEVYDDEAYEVEVDGRLMDVEDLLDLLERPGVRLGQLSEGNPADWKWNYRNYCRRKGITTLETGLDSDDVYLKNAHLLRRGMALYAGAVRYRSLVCAISGLKSKEDKYYAHQILVRAFEICGEMALTDKKEGVDFVGLPLVQPNYGTADDDSDDRGWVPNYLSFLDEQVTESGTDGTQNSLPVSDPETAAAFETDLASFPPGEGYLLVTMYINRNLLAPASEVDWEQLEGGERVVCVYPNVGEHEPRTVVFGLLEGVYRAWRVHSETVIKSPHGDHKPGVYHDVGQRNLLIFRPMPAAMGGHGA